MSQVTKAIIAFIITLILLSCLVNNKQPDSEANKAIKTAPKTHGGKETKDKKVLNDTSLEVASDFPIVKIPTSGARRKEYYDASYIIMQELIQEYELKCSDSDEVKKLTLTAIQDYLNRLHRREDALFKEEHQRQCRIIRYLKPKDPLTIALINRNLPSSSIPIDPNHLNKYSLHTQAIIESWSSEDFIKKCDFSSTISYLETVKKDNQLRYAWNLIHFAKTGSRQNHNALYKKLIKHSNNFHPWLQHMIKGTYHYNRAWDTKTLPDTGTLNTEISSTDHIHLAEKHYLLAIENQKNIPDSMGKMVAISGFKRNQESMLKWFNKTVSIEFDNHQAYNSYLFFSLPNRGGSIEKMVQFAKACATTNAYETTVPSYYINACNRIANDLASTPRSGWKIVQDLGLDKQLEEIFFQTQKVQTQINYISEVSKKYYPSIYLAMLIHTKQYDKIKEFEKIYPYKFLYWNNIETSIHDLEFYKSLASLKGSPNKPEINQLLSRYFEDFTPANSKAIIDVSREDYQLILDIQNNNKIKGLEPVLNYMNNFLEFQYTLHSGEWLNIDFVKHRSFYTPYNFNDHYNYKIESANAFRIDSNKIFYITFPKDLPQNLEIEYDFEHVSNKRSRFSLFGFSVYSRDAEKKMSLLADLHAATAYVYIPNKDWKWSPFVPKRSDKTANVKIKLWPNLFQYNFNNGDYFYCTENGVPDISTIRFGTRFKTSSKGLFRLKNIRLRKHDSPTPQMDTPEEFEHYYTQTHPIINQRGVKRFLANYYMQEKKYDKSLALYKQSISRSPLSSTAMELGDLFMKVKNYTEATKAYLQAYQIGDHPVLKERGFKLYIETLTKYPTNETLKEANELIGKLISESKNPNEKFKLMINLCKIKIAQKDILGSEKTLIDLKNAAKSNWHKNQLKGLQNSIQKLKVIKKAA
jgi:hypothetical protein